jgi:hypothetical protein
VGVLQVTVARITSSLAELDAVGTTIGKGAPGAFSEALSLSELPLLVPEPLAFPEPFPEALPGPLLPLPGPLLVPPSRVAPPNGGLLTADVPPRSAGSRSLAPRVGGESSLSVRHVPSG